MDRNRKILVGLIALLASTFYLLTNCRDKETVFQNNVKSRNQLEASKDQTQSPLNDIDTSPSSPTNQTPGQYSAEVRGLMAMTTLMADAIRPETTLEQVITRLKEFGVEPEWTFNSNEDTGSMVTVQTNNPFRGTRYFKAQYFGGDGNAPFPQYLAFEFRPGPNAMKEAQLALKQSFPQLGQPLESFDDYAFYQLDDDYVVRVIKMTVEDLQDDTFHAYVPADVGTVRISIELDIHPEGDEHDHDHELVY